MYIQKQCNECSTLPGRWFAGLAAVHVDDGRMQQGQRGLLQGRVAHTDGQVQEVPQKLVSLERHQEILHTK